MIFKISRLLNLSSVSCPDYFNAVPREADDVFLQNFNVVHSDVVQVAISV